MIEVAPIPIPPGLEKLPELVEAVLPDIAEAVRAHIISRAHVELHTSSQDYVMGVQPVKLDMPGKLTAGGQIYATIVLTGMIPNMIEQGWNGGDMKPVLLAGRNAKTGKDGTRYNTVPFRHGTPGVTGRNMPEMGSQFRHVMKAQDAARLGKRVHDAAKKLKPGQRLPAGMAPKLRSHHVTDIFASMVRQQGPARSTQYMTWRRVSDKSDPRSWIHPGIVGRHLFRDAGQYAQTVASKIFAEAIRG